MNSTPPARNTPQDEPRWGYAIAGGIALGVAAVLQFALGELSPEAQDNLPYVGPAYKVAGKPGLTVPLAAFGLGLVVWGVLRNLRKPTAVPGEHGAQPAAPQPDEQSGVKIPGLVGSPSPSDGPVRVRGAGGQPGGKGGHVKLSSSKYLGWKGKSG